jgi:hypothetical protein
MEQGVVIMDETRGSLRMWVTLGLIGLTTAFGYSIGVDRRVTNPDEVPRMEIPLDANTVYQFRAAGERARAAGDEPTAQWFEHVSSMQRERLLTWNLKRPATCAGQVPAPPSPLPAANNGG